MNAGTEKGFSLVELLVAMTIGLFLLGGVFAVYLETQATRRTADTIARMQENGRFATMFIAAELKRAGYWGRTTYEGTLEGSNSNTPMTISVANDCADASTSRWTLDLGREVEAFDNDNPYNATCLPDGDYLDGTDVLVIRSASTRKWDYATEISAPAGGPGKIFIRSDLAHGKLFEGGDAAPDPAGYSIFEDHRYNVSLYYVRPYSDSDAAGNPVDSFPALRRLVLEDVGADPRIQNEKGPIARGVEDFQVQFGIADGANVKFVDPGSGDIAADKSNIVAVRFWLLLRAEKEELGYTNDTTYNYAGKSRTFNDGYRRLLFSRTVQTRNLAEIS